LWLWQNFAHEGSTKVVVIPNLGKVAFSKLNVPYKPLEAVLSRFNMVNKPVAAAVPDAVTTAIPPSIRWRCSKHHLLDYLIL
jgi:hypothetical protein